MTRTDWSMIRSAISDGDEASSAQAMEQVARRYWPSVYAFLRTTGMDVHEASDLTQGFVCDVIIGRRLLEIADPARGRFRALLLTALRNYLREVHRNENATSRGGQETVIALDPAEMAAIRVGEQRTPDEAFTVQWSATLVGRVLEQVRQACLADGLEPHWTVFESRVVRPLLFGEDPAAYPELVDRYGLKDVSQAANMMVTVKRRFARALYFEVCRTVNDPQEANEELGDLLQTLGSSWAAPGGAGADGVAKEQDS